MDEVSNVIPFPGTTLVDLDPNVVLESAIDKLDTVILMGYDKDENYYWASNISDGKELSWLAQKFLTKLHNGDFA